MQRAYRVYKWCHTFRFVRGMAVHNQESHTLTIVRKTLKKFDKLGSFRPPIDSHEPELRLRTDCRDQIQATSRSPSADYWCFPFNRPRGSSAMTRSNTRLVSKKDHRFASLRQLTNTRIFLLETLLNFFRPLLVSTPYRALKCHSQLGKQPAYRGIAQLHTKLFIDDLPNHLGSREGKRKLELQRVLLGYCLTDPLNCLR